jgi:hypothetical protein
VQSRIGLIVVRMASEYASYNPAPRSPRLPPPPPSPHPAHLQAPQISPRRFAVQPPLLNTTLAPPHQQGPSYLHGSHSTPATASSLSLPFSPSPTPSTYAPSPIAAASPMAMRGSSSAVPYNPQQWTRGGNVSGQHVQHSQTSVPTRMQDVTGMEGIYHFLLPQVRIICNRWREMSFFSCVKRSPYCGVEAVHGIVLALSSMTCEDLKHGKCDTN